MPKREAFDLNTFDDPFMVPCEWSSQRIMNETLSFESHDSFLSNHKVSTSSKELITTVRYNDVLCGRGGKINSHCGNLSFRKLVKTYQAPYLKAKRKDKPIIATSIVETIHARHGRFLKKDDRTGAFYEVEMEYAKHKTCQALRENAPTYTKVHNINHVGARKSKVMRKRAKNGKDDEASEGSSIDTNSDASCQPIEDSITIHKPLPFKRIRLEGSFCFDTLSLTEREQLALFQPPSW